MKHIFNNRKKRNNSYINHYSSNNTEDLTLIYAKIGKIVERVNFIELRINEVIADFYISSEKRNLFLEDFMFAGRLRLNDKVKILRTILHRKNISFDELSFERWIHIRNMVAHGTPRRDNNRRASFHFNGQIYDINNEFRDFEKLQIKMEQLMDRVYKK